MSSGATVGCAAHAKRPYENQVITVSRHNGKSMRTGIFKGCRARQHARFQQRRAVPATGGPARRSGLGPFPPWRLVRWPCAYTTECVGRTHAVDTVGLMGQSAGAPKSQATMKGCAKQELRRNPQAHEHTGGDRTLHASARCSNVAR